VLGKPDENGFSELLIIEAAVGGTSGSGLWRVGGLGLSLEGESVRAGVGMEDNDDDRRGL